MMGLLMRNEKSCDVIMKNRYGDTCGLRRAFEKIRTRRLNLNVQLIVFYQDKATISKRLLKLEEDELSRKSKVPLQWRKVALQNHFTVSSGSKFAFLDRKEAYQLLAKTWEARFDSPDTPRHSPVPFLADGRGTGKSRFLDEINLSFNAFVTSRSAQFPRLSAILKKALYLRVDFQSGYDNGLQDGIAGPIALRLLHPYIDNTIDYFFSLNVNGGPLVELLVGVLLAKM
jgi:hypothetical protein